VSKNRPLTWFYAASGRFYAASGRSRRVCTGTAPRNDHGVASPLVKVKTQTSDSRAHQANSPLLARLIGIVARGGASKGFPGGVGEDSFGVGEVCAQGVGLRCGGMPGGVDGGPDELLGGSEP